MFGLEIADELESEFVFTLASKEPLQGCPLGENNPLR
jgi:hypothetical protein